MFLDKLNRFDVQIVTAGAAFDSVLGCFTQELIMLHKTEGNTDGLGDDTKSAHTSDDI